MHLTKNDRKAGVCSAIRAKKPTATNELALHLQDLKSLKGIRMEKKK